LFCGFNIPAPEPAVDEDGGVGAPTGLNVLFALPENIGASPLSVGVGADGLSSI
jgi:hypothetical protein